MRWRQASQAPLGKLVLTGILALLVVDCGGKSAPPKRAVLEQDLAAWKFRRYQRLLDVEVWIPDNPGVAHTASYVHRDALKRGRVGERDVVHAFVTRYRKNRGIQRRLVVFVRRLAQEAGYMVEEDRVKGTRLIRVSGQGEEWVLWAAERHLVKIGGQAVDSVPAAIIGSYSKRYPSRLEAGLLESPAPPGESAPQAEDRPATPESSTPDSDEERKSDKPEVLK